MVHVPVFPVFTTVSFVTDVLKYHAATDTFFSAGLNNRDVIDTIQGDDIIIIMDENGKCSFI